MVLSDAAPLPYTLVTIVKPGSLESFDRGGRHTVDTPATSGTTVSGLVYGLAGASIVRIV